MLSTIEIIAKMRAEPPYFTAWTNINKTNVLEKWADLLEKSYEREMNWEHQIEQKQLEEIEALKKKLDAVQYLQKGN